MDFSIPPQWDGQNDLHFQGILSDGNLKGTISTKIKGKKGFGYDPIFIPKGKKKTFGEMQPAKKYKIDHRYFAFKKLRKFL